MRREPVHASGVPTLVRSASVSPASVIVRADGAAFFQFRYGRPATARHCSVTTQQIDPTP